jgi:gluconate 2-dehydrogenase
MKPKVILYKKVDSEVLDYLNEICNVVYFEKLNAENYQKFLNELKDADGLIGSGLKVDKKLLDKAQSLKVVSNISVGYDNLNLHELSQRENIATNTPNVLNDTVADTIMGLILASARRITELDHWTKTGQWKENLGEKWFGVDVHHKKLGIIGMGRIGEVLAKRAHLGFDMDILYHNRSRKKNAEERYHAKYCTLEDLLKESDFVCVMTPHTPETEKMISEDEFRLMKNTAIFINASRGKVVDETALVEALRAGEILSAGLDVFAEEPVRADHPLLTMSNVVTLPHIGSATYETRKKMAMFAAENLIAALLGKTPPAQINS